MNRLILAGLTITLISIVVGCSAPVPIEEPKRTKKRICVAHECRAMGPGDNGGTTRGYTDESQD